MERKIQWVSGCFDEIELVYDKASQNETAEGILSELETGALAEARAYSDKINVGGKPVTPEQFDAFPDHMKEQVISTLSTMGLAAFSAPLTEPKIVVRLTPAIQRVRCCTAFSILNRLEKLDGAFNMLHPKATLVLQVPLGGKKGMFQIELLIMQLYPWLQINEVSSGEIAMDAAQNQPPEAPKPQPKPEPAKAPEAPKPQPKPEPAKAPEAPKPQPKPEPAKVPEIPKPDSAKPSKPGFFARLFGKKKQTRTDSPAKEDSAASGNLSAQERFYHEMRAKPAFRNAFSCAIGEVNNVLIKKQFNIKNTRGEALTIQEWQQLSETEQLKHILALGGFSIVPSRLLCVDFVEIIPYCIAITLLFLAYTGEKEKQLLDTGDGANNTTLKIAVESLKPCCPKWECTMFSC